MDRKRNRKKKPPRRAGPAALAPWGTVAESGVLNPGLAPPGFEGVTFFGDMRDEDDGPDYADPFGPAGREPMEEVRCGRCKREFRVKDVKWEPDANGGIWVCPGWPACEGRGIGADIRAIY
jgi:hypothetical protein